MFDSDTVNKLFSGDATVKKNAISSCESRLISAGYRFLGYHGTNLAGAKNMVPDKLDPNRQGSNAGLARGPGFYVAKFYNLAHDFAVSSTKTEGKPPRYEEGTKDGDAGVPVVLRVYGFEVSQRHQAWGMMNQDIDVGRDLEQIKEKLKADAKGISTYDPDPSKQKLSANAKDLELVIMAGAYPLLVVIPDDRKVERRFATWSGHDEDSMIRTPERRGPANKALPKPGDLAHLKMPGTHDNVDASKIGKAHDI